MIHAYVDTNVLLDFLAERDRFYKPARKLLTFAYQGVYDLWINASQSADLFYTLTNRGKPRLFEKARRALANLFKQVHIVSMGEQEVFRALASDIEDYEDALILSCAMSVGADVIVTRDKGLENGLIPTRTPEEFFSWLEEKHGVTFTEMRRVDGTWTRAL